MAFLDPVATGVVAAAGSCHHPDGSQDEAGKRVVETLGWAGYLGGYYGAMAATGVAGLVMSYLCSNSSPVIPPISQDNQSRSGWQKYRGRPDRRKIH